MKYYAVKKGRKTGVYGSWAECEEQVKGYPSAIYKSFASFDDAKAFITGASEKDDKNALIAYVDGSFNSQKKIYGYGAIIIKEGKVITTLCGADDDPKYASMHNVAGEINASMAAVQYAIDHGYHKLVIYYDYAGIENWATGNWQTNKQGTAAYADFMRAKMKEIKIIFKKVTAHSGDRYNDMADAEAKKAVGL